MTEREMEGLLWELLEGCEDTGVRQVSNYEEAEILTMDRGLVVKMEDGSVFQITIVKAG